MKISLSNFFYKKNRLQQIKGFYYAARHLSISEAAREMNLTQSTVTLQIQSLERDLGLKLFRRDTKSLSLTADGEDFYRTACPLMHEFESVLENFLTHKKQDDQNQKKVTIAVHHIAIIYLMPRIIFHFKKSHPNTEITIRNISPKEAIERLKNDQIDLALYPNIPHAAEIKQIETISYDPVLIMNKKHPLAGVPITSLKDLKNFDLIHIDGNLITLPLFEEAIAAHNIKGSIKFENGDWQMLKNFVRENNFVAVVSTICLSKRDSDLVVKNLANLFPKMSYGVLIKSGKILRPTTQHLLDAIEKTVKERLQTTNN